MTRSEIFRNNYKHQVEAINKTEKSENLTQKDECEGTDNIISDFKKLLEKGILKKTADVEGEYKEPEHER